MKKRWELVTAALLLCLFATASTPLKLHDTRSKTTTVEEDVTCAICGTVTEFSFMASTSSMGYSDLDMRPPPIARYTLWLRVQRCPNCEYCACNIEDAPDEDLIKEILDSDDYLAQLEDENFPDLANSFLCRSMIEEELGEPDEACWSTINAAWVCDDEEDIAESAVECRLRAIELFDLIRKEGDEIVDPESDACLMADLLRRVGEFDRAMEICEAALEGDIKEEILVSILEFQIELIEVEDVDAHSMGELPDIEDFTG